MINICLIEDEENIVELIRLNLELEGFTVHSIQNGMKAKEMINEVIQHDLIILDVMLPEYSGFDLCKDIRALSDTPIFFLSAKVYCNRPNSWIKTWSKRLSSKAPF